MKKVISPLLFIAEWILFLYVFLLILAFNLSNYANVLFVDMPWEEPIIIANSTSSFTTLVLMVVGLCIICLGYSKYFTGESVYKRFKALAWGILFALNLMGCLGYLLLWYGFGRFDFRNADLNLLLFITLVSILLVTHFFKKSTN